MIIDQLQTLIRQVAQTEVMPRFLHVSSQKKQDGSLFTEADLAAQNSLEQGLRTIIACPVLGEEMPESYQRDLWSKSENGLWVVDPIDGTTNFVNGIPHFALSVAYVKNGISQLGAIFNPLSNEMFYAQRNHGAYLNGMSLPITRVNKRLKDAVAAIEVKYLPSGQLASRIHTLSPCASQRNFGSSTLDWCYLAMGRFDVYLHGGQKLWDYAAGALIFEEAGGFLNTLEGDEFWNSVRPTKRSVIAALEQPLFEEWLAWVRANQ